jgi:hypothetical protein
MIERVHDNLDIRPRKLIADTGYGSAEMLAWLVHAQNIEPHIPVFDKSARIDGTFSGSEFVYDSKTDAYTCPAGKLLKRRQRRHHGRPDIAPSFGALKCYHVCRKRSGAKKSAQGVDSFYNSIILKVWKD